MKPSTKCGRVHFEHSHRKWLVITVRPTTSVRKSPRKNLPPRNTPDSFCRLLHPTKSIAALRGRYFSFMVTCRGGGPSILLTQDRSVAQKPHWGFCCCANASLPWQAEQAHHTTSKEKQSVPDGERPVVHIAIVCGFLQGASYSGAHPVFCYASSFSTRSIRYPTPTWVWIRCGASGHRSSFLRRDAI